MTPKILSLIIEGRKQRIKEKTEYDNYISYIQGAYFADALKATVGNMFKKNNSKPYEYPKKPYDLNEKKELTEEELQKQRELFVAKLQVMKANFELSRKDNSVS